ncbi:hypothetical protein A9Q99_18680 [Gammaproteobacteria bacterium 45_16_T64]|nr:hypothetical protein A9Q99_18680 [Gammaproteobacteria bacterium 45_16_T64]
MFERCVVIPVYDESPAFIERMQAPAPPNTLFITVLNCPQSCTEEQRLSTQQSRQYLRDQGHVMWTSQRHDALQLIQTQAKEKAQHRYYWLVWDITEWCIDAALDPIAHHTPLPGFLHGVGYARKLGMDTALQLLYQQQISDPFLLSTDADAILPEGYFDAINSPSPLAGYIFPFQHRPLSTEFANGSVESQIYELSLRYYVMGLRWANCPWAFHTIGSTFAIHGHHYAANRGFPKREAGEDFYLLNKVAKTGSLLCLQSPTISLSDRASHRVPFGTGPAIERLTRMEDKAGEFMFYHPTCFVWLQEWMSCISALFSDDLTTTLETRSDNAEELTIILNLIGIQKAINHSRKQSKSATDFVRHMLTWFDAFRTLKFIHTARDHFLPSVTLGDWINSIYSGAHPFVPSTSEALHTSSLASKTSTLLTHIRTLEHKNLPYTCSIK